MTGAPEPRLDALPLHPGLCASCAHLLLVSSPRSTFVRCAMAEVDPRFPRYPRLPVLACAGFTARSDPDASETGA